MIVDLEQSGVTIDNKPVISGLYSLHETHGIPLDMILSYVNDCGFVPDWLDMYLTCQNRGMTHDKIMAKLYEATIDSFGIDWAENVSVNLKLYHKKNRKQK